MEPISRVPFAEPDRARVQEEAIASTESRFEEHIEDYVTQTHSFGGRYVCADLFKETFEAYRTSKESRNRYNRPVHNSATVLASEQLRRLVARPAVSDADRVILLTGIPGGGKTTSVFVNDDFPQGHHAIYEGQLAREATAFQKIDQVLQAGYQPVVVVVHVTPEDALRRTLRRFELDGRGAGVGVMADIQGGLQTSLAAVRAKYGEGVALQIHDHRNRAHAQLLVGWDNMLVLSSEGDRDRIEHRLRVELEFQRYAGQLSVAAFRQAHGAAPLGPEPRLGRGRGQSDAPNGDGSQVPGADRAAAFLARQPADALNAHPDLGRIYGALAQLADTLATKKPDLPLKGRHEALAKGQERLYRALAASRNYEVMREVPPRDPGARDR
jgi:Zeta toxin